MTDKIEIVNGLLTELKNIPSDERTTLVTAIIGGLTSHLKSIPAGDRTALLESACGGLRMAAEKLVAHETALAQQKQNAAAEADALQKRAKQLLAGEVAPTAGHQAPLVQQQAPAVTASSTVVETAPTTAAA